MLLKYDQRKLQKKCMTNETIEILNKGEFHMITTYGKLYLRVIAKKKVSLKEYPLQFHDYKF